VSAVFQDVARPMGFEQAIRSFVRAISTLGSVSAVPAQRLFDQGGSGSQNGATGIQFLFMLSFAGKSQIFDWSSTMFGMIRPSDTGRWWGGTGCGAGGDWLASVIRGIHLCSQHG